MKYYFSKEEFYRIQRLRKTFESEQHKIIITTHQGPDGDAIGSSLAVYHFLKNIGQHDVRVIVPNDYPQFLQWMPGQEQIINYMRARKDADAIIEQADFVFMLDFNSIKRTADMVRILNKIHVPRILIDHHVEPEVAAQHIFSIPTAAATCEILFHLLKLWNAEAITPTIATCLYTGLMTDTGNFCYDNTSAETFNIAAELLQMGADRMLAYDRVFKSYTEQRLRFMGYCINEKMQIFNGNTALIPLTIADQERFSFQSGDTEGFVNLPLSIDHIKFSALFLEKEDKIKMSFRSKGEFSVNDFARDNFGGGGHHNAAGADSRLSMEELTKKFINSLPAYQHLIK